MAIKQTDEVKTFLAAQAELRTLGLSLVIACGEYKVNFRTGSEATAYYTGDLADAIATGRIMAEDERRKLPPLGPTGRRHSRKAIMYRHNAKIAAQRRARGWI